MVPHFTLGLVPNRFFLRNLILGLLEKSLAGFSGFFALLGEESEVLTELYSLGLYSCSLLGLYFTSLPLSLTRPLDTRGALALAGSSRLYDSVVATSLLLDLLLLLLLLLLLELEVV